MSSNEDKLKEIEEIMQKLQDIIRQPAGSSEEVTEALIEMKRQDKKMTEVGQAPVSSRDNWVTRATDRNMI